jgi:hypothetical protein
VRSDRVVDISKLTTWCWYLGKLAKYPCIFYANGVKKKAYLLTPIIVLGNV